MSGRFQEAAVGLLWRASGSFQEAAVGLPFGSCRRAAFSGATVGWLFGRGGVGLPFSSRRRAPFRKPAPGPLPEAGAGPPSGSRRRAAFRKRAQGRRSEEDAGAEQADDDQGDGPGDQTDAVGDGSRRVLRIVECLEVLRWQMPRRRRMSDRRRPPVGWRRVSTWRSLIVDGPDRGDRLGPAERLGGRIGALPVRVVVRDAGGGAHVHRRYNRRGTTTAPLSAYPRSRGHSGRP